MQLKASRAKYFAVSLALACACGSSAADLDKRLLLQDEAFLCELRGDWLCAAERYRASLQMEADDLPTLHRYARARASMGDYAGAAEIIDRIERQIPGGAIAPLLRADLGPFLGDEQALIVLSDAEKAMPDFAQARTLRAAIYARLGRHSEAIAEYERAQSDYPQRGAAFGLGATLVATGREIERGCKLINESLQSGSRVLGIEEAKVVTACRLQGM